MSCIAIDPDDADNVIVAYSNYNIYSLFQSTNGGQTWAKVWEETWKQVRLARAMHHPSGGLAFYRLRMAPENIFVEPALVYTQQILLELHSVTQFEPNGNWNHLI
ncbi:MAG: hypothetical protein R2792_13760 [Saprospiraceae bacterium]